MQRRHSQSVAGSRRYIVSVVKKMIEIFVYGRERTCQDNFTPRNSPLISPLLPQTGTDFAHTSRTAFLTYL